MLTSSNRVINQAGSRRWTRPSASLPCGWAWLASVWASRTAVRPEPAPTAVSRDHRS